MAPGMPVACCFFFQNEAKVRVDKHIRIRQREVRPELFAGLASSTGRRRTDDSEAPSGSTAGVIQIVTAHHSRKADASPLNSLFHFIEQRLERKERG